MKIYVAARFTEKTLVETLYTKLRARGHEITADWTQHEDFKPYDKHAGQAGAYAAEDIDGTITSEVFIYLSSPEVGAGLSAELGAALACHALTGKPKIYVVGEHLASNAFHFHPSVTHVASIPALFSVL